MDIQKELNEEQHRVSNILRRLKVDYIQSEKIEEMQHVLDASLSHESEAEAIASIYKLKELSI